MKKHVGLLKPRVPCPTRPCTMPHHAKPYSRARSCTMPHYGVYDTPPSVSHPPPERVPCPAIRGPCPTGVWTTPHHGVYDAPPSVKIGSQNQIVEAPFLKSLQESLNLYFLLTVAWKVQALPTLSCPSESARRRSDAAGIYRSHAGQGRDETLSPRPLPPERNPCRPAKFEASRAYRRNKD
jgi:hypothetical protein